MAAASSSSTSKISLKLLVDKKAQKVLFAEANKQFVDFLFHILSLPIGTVNKLLTKNSMVGSLGNLYHSIENLSDTYMQPNQSRNSLLNPKIANYGTQVPLLLLPNDDAPMAKNLYSCSSNGYHTAHSYVADDPTAVCPECNSLLNKKLSYVAGSGAAKLTAEDGGFVKGVVTYMIMDDLEVKPMSTISSITMLNNFNVKEIGGLEEKLVFVGMEEGLMILKASFECKNVLTTVFLA